MAERLEDAKIDALIPTPIMRLRWDEATVRNPQLVETILAREKTEAGATRSNKGGWHSENDMLKWGGEAAQALLKFVVAAAGKATKQVMMGQEMEAFKWQVIMWANVNRSGHYNAAHIHTRSTWSGVYYPDVGEPDPDYPSNGVLVLHNPKGGDRIGFLRSPYMPLTYHIDPEPGLMVLFPSHLVHSVNPYQGSRPRISISFNLMKAPYP